MILLTIVQAKLKSNPQNFLIPVFAQSWTALFRAFSSHRQPTAAVIKVIPQLYKTLGQTGQTLRDCTVA